MDLQYSIEDFDFYKLVKVSGNLSVLSAEQFEYVIYDILKKFSIIVDCEKISLLTSAGLNSFINISMYAKDFGHRVMLLHVKQDFYNLAETLNILDYLIIVETLDEGRVKIKHYT